MRTKKKDTRESDEALDRLMGNARTYEEVQGVIAQLTKAVVERALRGELTAHLGYSKHDPAGANSGNSRNGTTKKTLKGSFGEMVIETPRDRNGDFEPQLVKKGQRRWPQLDGQILSLYASLYARGLTTREIQEHLEEIYHTEVSPALISEVTDEVTDEVRAWQNRDCLNQAWNLFTGC